MKTLFFSVLLLTCGWLGAAEPGTPAAAAAAAPGTTRIATWQDDRTATFLLMFDDSCPSHWQMAIPEMAKRQLIGTFYLNCGKAEFTKFRKQWETIALPAGMVMGNHTATHQGVRDAANAEAEIGGCNATILELIGAKQPRLISFAQPGVGPGKWNISGDEFTKVLAAHQLINRPPFNDHGAVYALKTPAQMLAVADRAIAAKGMEYLIFHGIQRVGIDWGYQDFWAQNFADFKTVLDGLVERREHGDLWLTDHISWHQYVTERASATVTANTSNQSQIALTLTCRADPALYDLPLTLVTNVPTGWTRVEISQGKRSVQTVAVHDGHVTYQALPGSEQIVLLPKP